MGTKSNPLTFVRTISPILLFYKLKFHKKKLTFAAAPDETSSFSMTAVLKLFHSVWTSPNPSPLRLEWEAPHLTACDVTFRYVGPKLRWWIYSGRQAEKELLKEGEVMMKKKNFAIPEGNSYAVFEEEFSESWEFIGYFITIFLKKSRIMYLLFLQKK